MLRDIVESSQGLIACRRASRSSTRLPSGCRRSLGDEAALRRVFQNLIANAIKYGERGGWVGVRAQPDGPARSRSPCDRGIGIAPAEQSRIFEPFYRAPDVVAAQIQGAGLGLSLVKRIVEAHGGRVSVRERAGRRQRVHRGAAHRERRADRARRRVRGAGHGSHA